MRQHEPVPEPLSDATAARAARRQHRGARRVLPPSDGRTGTDEGHAASQPRHCTHSSMYARTGHRPVRRPAAPPASRRCGRAVTRSRVRSPGTSGSAGGTARTRRTRRVRSGRARASVLTRAAVPGSSCPLDRMPPGYVASARRWAGRCRTARRCPASRSIQPPASCAARPGREEAAGVVGSNVHGPDADLGDPAHAADGVERSSQGPDSTAATEMRARCGPAGQRGASSTGSSPAASCWAMTSSGCPSSNAARPATVPRDARGPEAPAAHLVRISVGRRPHRALAGRGWHRRITWSRRRCVPKRTDEEPGQVVAGDVLHRRPAAPHQPPVGGHEPHLEQPVAQRPVARAAGCPTARPRATPPTVASGSRGSSAHSCPASPSTAASSATGVPAPTVTVRSAGSYRTMPRRRPDLDVPRARDRRPPTACARRPGRPRRPPRPSRRVELVDGRAATVRPTRPRGPRQLAAAAAARAGPCRVGPARRVERVPETRLHVEVVGGRRSSASRRASRARCRARPRGHRRHRRRCAGSRRRRRARAPTRPARARSNTISGCRLPSPAWKTFIIVSRCSAAIA